MLHGREFSGIGLGVTTLVIWKNVFLGIGSLCLRVSCQKEGLGGYRRKVSRVFHQDLFSPLGIGEESEEKFHK